MSIKILSYFVCFIWLLATVQGHAGHARQFSNGRIRRVFGQEALRQQAQLKFTTVAPLNEQIVKPHLHVEENNNKYYDDNDANAQATENEYELDENVAENPLPLDNQGQEDNQIRANNKQTNLDTNAENTNEINKENKVKAQPNLNSTLDTNNVDTNVNNVNGNKIKNKVANNNRKNKNKNNNNNKNKNKNQRKKTQRRRRVNRNQRIRNKNRVIYNNNNQQQSQPQQQQISSLVQQLLQLITPQGL